MPVGLCDDAHRRVGRVHGLPTGTGRAVDIDVEVLGPDLDLDLLGVRQDGDGGGGGVDPSGGLGHRHALHAVDPRLMLQPRVGVLPPHLQHDLFEPAELGLGGGEHLGLPTVPLGEAPIHLEQLAGPQRGLLTTRPGLGSRR